MQTKEPAEGKEKAPPPTADVTPEPPAKAEGPARPQVQRAARPGGRNPPVARAAATLAAPETSGGAPGQARAMTVAQQAVGNLRAGELAHAGADAPAVQRQATGTPGAPAAPAGAADGGAAAAPAYATAELKLRLAATILAESAAGQTSDIGWIYANLIRKAGGEAGLNASAAYKGKSVWYKIWLYMLGDPTYAGSTLPRQKEFTGFSTVAAFCTKNGYMQTVGAERAKAVVQHVETMFTQPDVNPYKGWTGQGNLNDFNNISQPGSRYWKQARAYYWLQQAGKVTAIYVKVLPAGKSTQFIFDADSIDRYYKQHPLPAEVPLYK
jgi:hypothetical protein